MEMLALNTDFQSDGPILPFEIRIKLDGHSWLKFPFLIVIRAS